MALYKFRIIKNGRRSCRRAAEFSMYELAPLGASAPGRTCRKVASGPDGVGNVSESGHQNYVAVLADNLLIGMIGNLACGKLAAWLSG